MKSIKVAERVRETIAHMKEVVSLLEEGALSVEDVFGLLRGLQREIQALSRVSG